MPTKYNRLPAKRKSTGFTLTELLVTVAIISILASLAIPAYTSYVARARRADARAQLTQVAQFMQRFYTANDSYAKDRQNNDVIDKIPDGLRYSPMDGNPAYQISIPAGSLTAGTYLIKMVPISGKRMDNDECGSFTLTSAGLRGVEIGGSAGSTALRDKCWK
jgi:type IV pilus assembly protein PilE